MFLKIDALFNKVAGLQEPFGANRPNAVAHLEIKEDVLDEPYPFRTAL